ncbi:FAD-binding oxidoreductase, partial [Candidatus Babeliales bacterium]|nr:FAD-binding oxidoreductase [Candidatus Babeliales bacterium]
TQYHGALLYPGSFSINPFAYCQGLKKHLIENNVSIFENSPVIQIDDHTIITPHAKIIADKIIVCIDKDTPDINMLNNDVYHVQTFVTASEPLHPDQIKKMFPQSPLLVWDTDLIYQYFRITPDNRLILGGGDLFSTYASEKHNYNRITHKLCCYFSKYFPDINLKMQYQWPGLIGISKDIAPIAGADQDKPHVFYVAASAGLPIAAMLGAYAVDYLFNKRKDLDDYFSPYRSFPISGWTQKIIGTKLAFMISNVIKQNVP